MLLLWLHHLLLVHVVGCLYVLVLCILLGVAGVRVTVSPLLAAVWGLLEAELAGRGVGFVKSIEGLFAVGGRAVHLVVGGVSFVCKKLRKVTFSPTGRLSL